VMTPGPVEISPRVLSALSQPSIYHYDSGFIELFKECTEKAQKIFSAKDRDVLLLQGEGVLGLEAAVACTIDKGESVLVFENGPFGRQFGEYVKNIGAHPVFSIHPTTGFSTEKVLQNFWKQIRTRLPRPWCTAKHRRGY
jgi:aspartate aminotransferase-like enzyme